jgi:hypothetical protein
MGAVHAAQVEPNAVKPGERVVVIGGGLTAAQLCAAAAARDAHVIVLTRASLRVSNTDVDPRWLSSAYLAPYFAEPDWEKRADAYRQARRGTLPAAWAETLRGLTRAGRVTLCENVTVTGADHLTAPVGLRTSLGTIPAERLWLATGWTMDARHDPLLAPHLHAGTTRCGLPILDPACRLPGTSIHLMGTASALQTGALAPNLAGARIAAERIVANLTGLPDRVHARYPTPADGDR